MDGFSWFCLGWLSCLPTLALAYSFGGWIYNVTNRGA